MPLNEMAERIESLDFAAEAGLSNSWRQFSRWLNSQPDLENLIVTASVEEFVQRLDALLQTDSDPEFEHRYDVAVATYLWLLSQVNLDIATNMASAARKFENLWWADRLASMLKH